MKLSIFNPQRLGFALMMVAMLIGSNACRRTQNDEFVKYDIKFVALTDDNNLLFLNSDDLHKSTPKIPITGMITGDKMLNIDYRPATGQLYGVSSLSRLYIINPETGVARALGTAAFSPAVNGTVVGLDFNPTVDRLRLVTNLGQNLRLNPETGAVVATDGAINPANLSISDVAYTNNKAGAATTILYDIDVNTDKLYRQDPPNAGSLVEVGALGVNVESVAGFDITTFDFALAALKVGGRSRLYTINLPTGRAIKIGDFPTNINIIGLAVSTEAVAYMVNNTNNLLIFNPFDGRDALVSKAITGLQVGENILGLDMRPVNGQLYALGSSSRLYTINAASGAAAAVGTTPFATLLNGTNFGFDFNPTVDRIRIVSNNEQNLRANPETGAIAAVDAALNPAGMLDVSAAAYTNNFAGTTTTTLYVLDALNKKLYIQNPPNNGTLVFVGNLPTDFVDTNGFDIGGTSGRAYALLNNEGIVGLYNVNLTSAKLKLIRPISSSSVRGFTLGLGF